MKTFFTGKPCKNGHVADRYISNKTCVECSTNQQRNWHRDNIDRYREYQREYYAADPAKVGEYQRQFRLRNLDKMKEKDRIRRETNPEYFQNWWKENKDKAKEYYDKRFAENPEVFREYCRKWSKANPEYMRAKNMLRQSRVRQATPSWVNEAEVFQICLDCPPGYHVDHIIPIKGITPDGYPVSGLNIPLNMQYLPAKENNQKYNRMRQQDYQLVIGV